jgi:hypothetical protein
MGEHVDHRKNKFGSCGQAGFPTRMHPHVRHPAPFTHQSIGVI